MAFALSSAIAAPLRPLRTACSPTHIAPLARLPLGPTRPGAAPPRRRTLSPCRAALSPDVVFNIATLGVMPFYALIIGAPTKPLTRRLLASPAPFAIAAAIYAALLAAWAPLGRLWAIFTASAFTAGGLPDVRAFAAAFSAPEATALAWLHLVTLDLFQARWVYLDGQRRGVPVAHSAVLCFMVGPLGLLCHLITRSVVEWMRRRRGEGSSGVLAQ